MSNVSLDTLPVEILHRIFDRLDACTIIRSVRCVSKYFNAVVNSYDRFELDFTQFISSYSFYGVKQLSNVIRNSDLKPIFRCIQSSKVISLVFSGSQANENGIDFFLKNFNMAEFTRLRSLSLFEVSSNHVNQILQRVTTQLLVSLTINLLELPNNTIFSTIFPVIIQTNLQKLCWNNLNYTNIEIPWPNQSTLQQLTIKNCTYQGYCIILDNSHSLRTLVIDNCVTNNANETRSLYAVAASNSAKRQRTSIDSTGTDT
jgi:hypothetical protein